MFLELVAVIVAGLGAGGIMLLLSRLVPGRLPRWLIPVAAGAAMLAASISLEYTWYPRTAGTLPDGLAVAESVQRAALWRPWTYLAPITDRFVAVDTASLQANRIEDQLWMADLYFYGRWQTVQAVEVMVDCATARRADPALGDGSPPVWRDVGPDDPVVATVCAAV